MTGDRIETFLTLCRLMNYRRTAEELNMTQPAVTQHIHYLEERYGCKLFLYDRRTLKMTPEAETLKKYAETVRYQERRLEMQLRGTGTRSLAIGATKTIGEYVIAGQVSRYLSVPENRLSVEVDNTEHLLDMLSKGKLDFALIEGFFDRRKFASLLYRTEPFLGICAKTHPFAGRTVPLEEIWGENLLLREEGSGTRNILEQLLYERNHSVAEFSRITTIGNFGLMAQVLEQGESITFAYQAVKKRGNRLASFRVEGMSAVREFNYVFLDTPVSLQAVEYFDSFRPDGEAGERTGH